MDFVHKSVLLNECIEGLKIKQDGIYVDGTLGGAGHSSEIIKKINNGKLIGIDRDDDALKAAKDKLKEYNNVIYYHGNHDDIKEILNELNIDGVDGIFASSDLIAAQVIQVCYELNIKIPKDIKLVGFDDVEISQLTTPTITTIQQPIKEMAKLAIHLIDAKYTNTEILEQTILPVDLVVRRSTSVE